MRVPLEPGTILAGKYQIDHVLGEGGMGIVVAARHLQLDQLVAIKFLLPDAVQDAQSLARFEREARAAVKIRNEHIARVIDVGTLEWGTPYMVMEYLRGRDLGAVLRERGPLPIGEAIEYVVQACEAIIEAHALGVVHRDLKPPNLFLSERIDGSVCVKVLDFGISKLTGAASSPADYSMTRTTTILGSPLYISPEQLSSTRDVDARTDIWALGVVLFELLTARLPFEAEDLPQLCAAILCSPPTLLRSFRPDAPEALEQLIAGCLEKDCRYRIQSVSEFAARLSELAPDRLRPSGERLLRVSWSGRGTESMLPQPLPAATSEQPLTKTIAVFGHTAEVAPKTKLWLLGSFAVVAVVVAGVSLLALTTQKPRARSASFSSTQVNVAAAPPAPALSASISTNALTPSRVDAGVDDSQPRSSSDADVVHKPVKQPSGMRAQSPLPLPVSKRAVVTPTPVDSAETVMGGRL